MSYSTKHFGFTLVELIFIILIISVISVVIGRSLFHGFNTFFTAQNFSQVDWQGFTILEKMVNDIHRIRTVGDIQTAQTSQLIFTDVNGQSIQYQLSGTSLLRNNILLAMGIQSLNLSYLDKNGSPTSTPAQIRYISISPIVAQSNLSSTFSTLAAIRAAP